MVIMKPLIQNILTIVILSYYPFFFYKCHKLLGTIKKF